MSTKNQIATGLVALIGAMTVATSESEARGFSGGGFRASSFRSVAPQRSFVRNFAPPRNVSIKPIAVRVPRITTPVVRNFQPITPPRVADIGKITLPPGLNDGRRILPPPGLKPVDGLRPLPPGLLNPPVVTNPRPPFRPPVVGVPLPPFNPPVRGNPPGLLPPVVIAPPTHAGPIYLGPDVQSSFSYEAAPVAQAEVDCQAEYLMWKKYGTLEWHQRYLVCQGWL